MNLSSTDLGHPATTADASAPLWTRPRTITVRAKGDPRPFGYPSVRALTPPADADLAAEEPERWDGLS